MKKERQGFRTGKIIRITSYCFTFLSAGLLILFLMQGCTGTGKKVLIISCSESNDLVRTLRSNGIRFSRYDTPGEAIENASDGSGVLILADEYPVNTVSVDSLLYARSAEKNLKLFIEYPSYVPGISLGEPLRTSLERVVVTTDDFPGLPHLQILCLHDCHYLPATASDPLLSVGKVAGFDRAVFGLDKSDSGPILFKMSDDVMISTTGLSCFVTARYAPEEAIRTIWLYILKYVTGEAYPADNFEWVPDVHPSYERDQKLPPDAARKAIVKGIDWHSRAGMVLNKDGWDEYKNLWNLNDSNIHTTVPSVNNAAPLPVSDPGDGSFGLLEGIASKVNRDGSQPARWWLRSDSNGESSLAFALRAKMDGDERSRLIAGNLLDWLYFTSGLFQNNPEKPNFGLLFWAPGNAQALYQDNDIKAILGCMGTSGILETDRWDEVLVKNILGNFRTTGRNGFRGRRIENPDLMRDGWISYRNRETVLLQPHYEAWTWASYLWLYDKTGWEPLLEKTKKGITMMMEAYPDGWRWTNGIQQERGRMLLPLAWLIRIDDRPEYRRWLSQIAGDIEKSQDESGAIMEELGALDRGDYVPSKSNAAYGTDEAPLIQQNGDAVADLLYTCNFTFLGLHEAYAATGDEQLKRMSDCLAGFLIRIQITSDKHTSLDGGWFRAFDFKNWEYMGSNADSGWGAWSIEVGWTQAWITSVLAMRELGLNLWNISENSKVGRIFPGIRSQMIPDSSR